MDKTRASKIKEDIITEVDILFMEGKAVSSVCSEGPITRGIGGPGGLLGAG